MSELKKMPIDEGLMRGKIKAKKAEILRLEGLIALNEEKADLYERSKPVYLAIVRQYRAEIASLESDITHMENILEVREWQLMRK